MIKAVIFDMDGLLVDSEPLWQEVEVSVFNKVGVPLTKEMTRETVGLKTKDVVEYWFHRYPWKKPTRKKVEETIVKEVVKIMRRDGVPKKGAEKILRMLYGKLPLAIASSSSQKIINAFLDKTGFRKYIPIAHSEENELYGKPHPGIYLTTAKKHKVEPPILPSF